MRSRRSPRRCFKQKSKKLTVRNAKRLDGKRPSAYLNRTRVYTITTATPSNAIDVVIPMTPGIRYNRYAYTAQLMGGSGTSDCSIAIGHFSSRPAPSGTGLRHSGRALPGLAS